MKLINWATIVFAAITLLVTIVFFAWWMMKDSIEFGSDKFDQIKWMKSAASIETDCKRGDMAYDLQQHILSKGTSKESVGVLLGRPSYEDGNAMEYDLGKCMHVYHGLLLYFDANNQLINSRISSH
jgi:outer membrane protein assembly factor BamE (lipoprotein component of BamABCDE complex)